jgi:hypothetical protein
MKKCYFKHKDDFKPTNREKRFSCSCGSAHGDEVCPNQVFFTNKGDRIIITMELPFMGCYLSKAQARNLAKYLLKISTKEALWPKDKS